MKNSSWIYKAIADYKNSKEQWIQELWGLTEEYFNKHVLPLLVFHPLTKDDKTDILFYGFQNILNLYKSKRLINYPTGNSMLGTMMFLSQIQAMENTPLDKTDIDKELFGAFLGFTFIASKDKYFLLDIYNKKTNISSLKTEIAKYEAMIKVYDKALEKNKTLQETSTDSMVEKLINVIDDTRKPDPLLNILEVKTGIEKYYWKERINNDVGFLETLREKLESKIKQAKAKETKEFWQGVLTHWWKIIEQNTDSAKSKRKLKLKENLDYTKTDRQIHKKGYQHNYDKGDDNN